MKVVSLFSGCGGLDLGLIQAGHEIIWANDFDADSVATYSKNINSHAVLSPIQDVLSSSVPDSDVVVGGFPCQGFSQANLLRFEDDERNRLYLEFLRIVRDKQPKYFLAENVRGILSLADGSAIKKIEEDFSAVGYRVKKQLFNVADYGVPQSRWRVIIAGTRKDLPESLDYNYPKATHGNPKSKIKGIKPWVTIKQALAGIPEPEEKHKLLNHIYSQYKVTNRTVTGRGDERGGVVVLHHPNNKRRMTARELAAVQSFPDNFKFTGAKSSAYRQIANAVPPLLGRAIGKMLKENEKLIVKLKVKKAG